MTVKFFGQFLIEKGELTPEQIREALDLMESENRTLGEIAVAMSFASREELRRVNGVQRRRDVRFGELALQMGILNSVELDEILLQQQRERVTLEQALVRLQHLSQERAGELLTTYEAEQAPYRDAQASLPEALRSNRLAQCVVDLTPRFCMRVARIEVKVGPGQPLEGAPELPLAASLEIAGNHGIHVGLATDEDFGEQLASGVSGLDLSALASDLAVDAIGEFLNVLAGNVVSALEQEGLENRIEAPQFGMVPASGFQFDIVSNTGRALLVISPHDL